MKLSKITIFKYYLCFIFFSLFIVSCEPEEVPTKENQPSQQFENILGETGDQAETSEDKDG